MSEETKYHVMLILPNGVISDADLTEAPRTGQYITINGKSYRVIEAHESAHENWDFCASLGN